MARKPAAEADPKGSDELFTEIDGKRQDAELHEPMLSSPGADHAAIAETRARLTAAGWSQADLDALYS